LTILNMLYSTFNSPLLIAAQPGGEAGLPQKRVSPLPCR